MWGVIHPNRTGNGIIGNLVERRADIGLGAISSWYHCYSFLTFSSPDQRGGVTCLTPKPNLLPRWKIVAMVFLTSVYLIIFGTFMCSVIIYTIIFQCSRKKPLENSVVWNAFNVFAVFLLQSTNNIRNRSVSETVLSVALLLFSLNIAAIYSGKYASLRTIPLYEKEVNSLEDLAESGIPWLQAHEAWTYSLLLSKNPAVMKLVSHFKVYPAPKLHQIADQGGSAFAMGRLHNGHLMLGDWINSGNIHNYQLMRGDLYYEHEVAMATKTWPLIEKFNELLHLTASGLLLRVQELRIMYQHNDYYVQTGALSSHEREPYQPEALAVEDVFGGLIVLGCGSLCAGVTFVIEVWLYNSQKQVSTTN
ncbi:AAEL000063-PA [Aedes aegypti]|uniref:AAEL000063-PA n=1 Tax=Aedes aegypti TaxID=7159 RepID=Q0C762_AEDAE|nr:AAEL000063-PA [Aedes aegypti]